jgi:SSS family solute:Na+ symporter
MHILITATDYTIIVIYVAFVIGIGFALKHYMKTSADFFLSGRSIPAWGGACPSSPPA